MIPRRGAIAVCSNGCLGIITSSEPQIVAHPDGKMSLAWTGFHLRDDPGRQYRIGSQWSSRNPEVQGYVEDLTQALLLVYSRRLAIDGCLAERATEGE